MGCNSGKTEINKEEGLRAEAEEFEGDLFRFLPPTPFSVPTMYELPNDSA
jgi:hypothetical protein